MRGHINDSVSDSKGQRELLVLLGYLVKFSGWLKGKAQLLILLLE